MAQVLIRQLDEHVVAALRARAQAQGLSLEQSLRNLLTAARHHTERRPQPQHRRPDPRRSRWPLIS